MIHFSASEYSLEDGQIGYGEDELITACSSGILQSLVDRHDDKASQMEYLRRWLFHAHEGHSMDDGDENDGTGEGWICEEEREEDSLADAFHAVTAGRWISQILYVFSLAVTTSVCVRTGLRIRVHAHRVPCNNSVPTASKHCGLNDRSGDAP